MKVEHCQPYLLMWLVRMIVCLSIQNIMLYAWNIGSWIGNAVRTFKGVTQKILELW